MKLNIVFLPAVFAALVNCISFTDPDERIFGGTIAELDKYTYIAALHPDGVRSNLTCAGTLIAPQFVLTSGLCLEYTLVDVYVTLGSKFRSNVGIGNYEAIRAVEAFRHPRYILNPDTLDYAYDVAILKLETPSTQQPAKLPAVDGSSNRPGVMATALGWGEMETGENANVLRAVDVQVITNKQCSRIWSTIVDKSFICAGNGTNKGINVGDWGGPLIVKDVVVGSASLSSNKNDSLHNLYARVSHALDFIHDILDGGSTGDVTELLTK
ncbi:hypothetical protein CCR75_002706 [Bremia lactucae]|uniref:Peptidase S1 domain-containing protein n=1 Tax=Bremia lactucae TaxID=4779 RepID=A0A976FQD5_BRELC|nr:hypothetical protein CCR75_002706 [Bremia lactucae]